MVVMVKTQKEALNRFASEKERRIKQASEPPLHTHTHTHTHTTHTHVLYITPTPHALDSDA